MIPEPLLIDLPEIYKCPKCNGSIADWVVINKFECPTCNRKLSSNKKLAIKKSALFSIMLYIILTVSIYTFSFGPTVEPLLYVAASILPMVAYYFAFKLLFKLEIRKNN